MGAAGKCSLLPYLCQLLSVRWRSLVVVVMENPMGKVLGGAASHRWLVLVLEF